MVKRKDKSRPKDEPLSNLYPEMRQVDPRENPPRESVITPYKRIIPEAKIKTSEG